MKRLVGLLAILFLSASIVPGSAAGPRASSTNDSVRSSASNGYIRCTVIFPNRTIRPGHATHARIKLTNVSEDDYFWHNPVARLAFRNAGGDLLWRTNVPYFRPNPLAQWIAPGQSVDWYVHDTRVRWTGPLEVRPICVGLGKRMPAVELHVAAPGPPFTTDDSIDAAVAFPDSPFQACAPGPQGQPRAGSLEPVAEDNRPPLAVRCWADVRTEAGFDVVGLNMASPDDAPDYTIREGTGPRPGEEVKLPGTSSFFAGRWSFVVTEDTVRPVFSKSFARIAGAGEFANYSYAYGNVQNDFTNDCPGEQEPYTSRVFDESLGRIFYVYWINTCSE